MNSYHAGMILLELHDFSELDNIAYYASNYFCPGFKAQELATFSINPENTD